MKTIKLFSALCFFTVITGFSSVKAAAIDLNTWGVGEYSAGAGTWAVAADGKSVFQSINGDPTFFLSDFDSQGSEFKGNIKVDPSNDNDYIGFALGINSTDFASPAAGDPAADYLLIDWKQADQTFNFDGTSTTANVGLAVSRVTGIPDRDEMWRHRDVAGGTGAVEELKRATNLGRTGWSSNVDYEFTFDFGPGNLDVYVDGVLELSIVGTFTDGRFAFYNFSHADVTYSGFTKDPGSFPGAVPVPAAVWLFGTALIGLVGFSKRRKAV